jgi:hypothetical protein
MATFFGHVLYLFLVLAVVYCGRNHVSMVVTKASRSDLSKMQIRKSNTEMIEPKMHNNRINTDWQFRCALLPAGYAGRYEVINNGNYKNSSLGYFCSCEVSR